MRRLLGIGERLVSFQMKSTRSSATGVNEMFFILRADSYRYSCHNATVQQFIQCYKYAFVTALLVNRALSSRGNNLRVRPIGNVGSER